jgi:hypothetical protein
MSKISQVTVKQVNGDDIYLRDIDIYKFKTLHVISIFLLLFIIFVVLILSYIPNTMLDITKIVAGIIVSSIISIFVVVFIYISTSYFEDNIPGYLIYTCNELLTNKNLHQIKIPKVNDKIDRENVYKAVQQIENELMKEINIKITLEELAEKCR